MVEPLPAEWRDGTQLRVEPMSASPSGHNRSADQWMDEVEALASRIPKSEDAKLIAAVKKIRQEARELARKGKR
jgi:phosphoserine phosphatase